MTRAASAGLAPPALYSDPAAGVLVYPYLEPDAAGPARASISELAGLLRRIHEQPPLAPVMDLAERIDVYGQRLRDEALTGWRAPARALCRELAELGEAPVLCHNDLSDDNLVRHGGELCALDWEYAACGSRWFDIAAAVELRPALAVQPGPLLAAYLRRPPGGRERRALGVARRLYRYLAALWYAANGVGGAAAATARRAVEETMDRVDP
jgi:aminoglycoside phosphotransferase (APT) family kinase protein